VEDGVPSFNTALGRKKPENIQRDPRVSLLVVDPEETHKWVALDGKAELTTEGADPQIDRLAKKYLDADEYPYRTDSEQRVTVRIAPDRISTSGLDG
jgi:PPOX class probable F420-dependent enzyme